MRKIIDIETCPLPLDRLIELMPGFEPNANLKDPAKIEACIAGKRQKWIDDAALSAITGRVLAIGAYQTEGAFPGEEFQLVHGDDEKAHLEWFWEMIREGGGFGGFNIFQFDLPFLVRRSWALGVPVPPVRNGRYWSGAFVDLREAWGLGDRNPDGTLDQIARHLGLEGKSGDGAQFATLYASDQAAALEYLKYDLVLTAAVAKRLGV